MITIRKRIYFRCPSCGHTAWSALQGVGTTKKNTYVCAQCGSWAEPQNYLFMNFIFGVALGGLIGIVAYWIFTRYLFAVSPAFSILSAVPIGIFLTAALYLVCSRLFCKWKSTTQA
jgi:predicted RNA-binding Zn-ribbon protein involved in translation (DUF1610 family)